jgi:hypothetical protein
MVVIPQTSFEEYFRRESWNSSVTTWIKEGEIFLFVGEIEHEKSTYSKILHRDKVYLANNVYYLASDVKRLSFNKKE